MGSIREMPSIISRHLQTKQQEIYGHRAVTVDLLMYGIKSGKEVISKSVQSIGLSSSHQ